jgi:aryl-alcohol dehydrogenase
METVWRDITVAVARAPKAPFTIEAARIRSPRSDEVLVRIVATGLCHTDLTVRDQHLPIPLPAVLGHEGSGIVEAVGPEVKDLAVGDHVVLTYGACGHCDSCHGGHAAYCKEFFGRNFGGASSADDQAVTQPDGTPLHDHFFAQSSFGTYAISRENNAIRVPKDAPLELLGPLGCGIQTGAGAVINSLKVTPGSRFASFGAGAVGLSAVMAARVAGATTIIAVDVVQSRLDLALELGATHVINSRDKNIVEAVQAICGGVDFAVESTGRPEVLASGIEALASLGTIGVVGLPSPGTKGEFDIAFLALNGRSIRGIIEGDSVPAVFIPQLVALYQQGRFPFDRLIKFYESGNINQAVEDTVSGATLKPVITFGK